MFDVTLELTRKCPLNCKFCSSYGGMPHEKELNQKEWISIIDQAIELGTDSFLISGGEPFTSPSFRVVCEYISKNGLNLTVYSSGNKTKNGKISPLEKKDLVFVSSLNFRKIIFNMQGSNRKIHDKITGVEGSFDNLISSAKNAREHDIEIEFHFVPTALNYFDFPNVVKLSKDLKAKQVSVLRFVTQGRGEENKSILELNIEQLIHLKEILNEATKGDDFVRVGAPFSPFGLSKTNGCNAAVSRITIRFDGRVVPCEAMKFLAEQNIDNDIRVNKLDKILNSSEIFDQAKNFRKIMLPMECENCEFLIKCKGGCPAQRLLHSKDNLTKCPDHYCLKRMTHNVRA